MTLEKAAWLAGFIDGEGCLHVARAAGGHHALQVHIACVHRPTMEEVARIIGAPLRKTVMRPRADSKGPWRPRWSVALCGAEKIAALLQEVLPYMVTKKEEAELMLALTHTFTTRGGPGSYTAEKRERREGLISLLAAAKARGYE